MTVLLRQNTTINALDDAILAAEARRQNRGHMGFSTLCDPDMRTTWLKFRWSLPDDFKPRTLRIFRLGHLIESEVIALMRQVPGLQWLESDPATGKQFTFSLYGGHVGGSMDGAVLGVPEAPQTWHVGEVKSAKDAKFRELVKCGSYKEWNPTYYGQLQCYMGASGMTRALAIVYNKDTSEIYVERIKPVPGYYENAQITAGDLLEVQGPPNSIYKRTDYRIKNYKSEEYQRIYWGDALPKPNCRNCKHAQIQFDGDARWSCNRWQKDISVAEQAKGCDLHLYMRCFVPAKFLEDHGTVMRYKTADGVEIWNSEDKPAVDGQHVYDSQQLYAITRHADLTGDTLSDPVILSLRANLGGVFHADEVA